MVKTLLKGWCIITEKVRCSENGHDIFFYTNNINKIKVNLSVDTIMEILDTNVLHEKLCRTSKESCYCAAPDIKCSNNFL